MPLQDEGLQRYTHKSLVECSRIIPQRIKVAFYKIWKITIGTSRQYATGGRTSRYNDARSLIPYVYARTPVSFATCKSVMQPIRTPICATSPFTYAPAGSKQASGERLIEDDEGARC